MRALLCWIRRCFRDLVTTPTAATPAPAYVVVKSRPPVCVLPIPDPQPTRVMPTARQLWDTRSTVRSKIFRQPDPRAPFRLLLTDAFDTERVCEEPILGTVLAYASSYRPWLEPVETLVVTDGDGSVVVHIHGG